MSLAASNTEKAIQNFTQVGKYRSRMICCGRDSGLLGFRTLGLVGCWTSGFAGAQAAERMGFGTGIFAGGWLTVAGVMRRLLISAKNACA